MRFRNWLITPALTVAATVALALPAAPAQAIVGGGLAGNGEYPWMAAVYLGGPNGQFCGGTLVRPTIVLTAAHCIIGGAAPAISGVLIGRNNLDGTGGETIPATGFILHPAWNVGLNIFDIAAIKLSRPSNAPTLPWATSADTAFFETDDTATIVGWGLTSEGGSPSNALREATVPIVSDASCQRSYGVFHVASQHLCAGYAEGGTDTCQGDSGGPLLVRNAANQFILAGITSWGEGCARPDRPGVYSEVAQLTTFIDAAVLLN